MATNTNTKQQRIYKASRRVKISCAFGLASFTAIFFAIQYFVDLYPWAYQGYGFMVWIVFGFSLLFGFFNAGMLVNRIKQTPGFYETHELPLLFGALEKGTRFATYRTLAEPLKEKILSCAQAVLKSYGLPDDYCEILVQNEPTPNAFAAGVHRKVIVLTSGLVQSLSEEELKGVIAHEVGHLKNSDIFMLVFTTSAIWSLVLIGRFIFNNGLYGGSVTKENKKSSSSFPLPVKIALMLVGISVMLVGYIVAPIASAFISRRREEMADAFACAGGHGRGLMEALKKIENYAGKTKPVHASAAALYINQTESGLVTLLFSTHPPISSRVKKIQDFLSDEQGRIPDWLEGLLASLIKWVVLPVIGLILIATSNCCGDLPGVWGIPFIFFTTVAWLYQVDSTMGSSVLVTDKESPKKLVILVAFIFIGILWAAGLYSIKTSLLLTGALVPFALISKYIWYAWMIKPVLAVLGTLNGAMAFLSDVVTYMSIMYALLILASLFTLVF